MDGHFGEMKKLINLLLKARIPFEHIVQLKFSKFTKDDIKIFGEAGRYMRNQIIYYRPDGTRVFDCILQSGSYGCREGLLETYGELGVDEEGNPMVMTAEEAFEIIKIAYFTHTELPNSGADMRERKCETE